MTYQSYVLLAGASRGVGREVAHYLVKQNLLPETVGVRALLRSSAAQAELEALGVSVAFADALDPVAVDQVFSADPIQAVISTIGGLPQEGERADYLGNQHLIDAAVKAGVQKFILVSSIGSGDSVAALPPSVLEALGAVLVEKEKAENYLINSGLTYTIIRPGGLKSEPATGNGALTEDIRIAGSIHRADVAQLVGQCLVSDRANNKVFSAVDRGMFYGQPDLKEFSLTETA